MVLHLARAGEETLRERDPFYHFIKSHNYYPLMSFRLLFFFVGTNLFVLNKSIKIFYQFQ